MDDAQIVAVTSELTLAEALIKPLKDQNQPEQQAYKKFLTPTPVLQVVPISKEILEEAARIRALALCECRRGRTRPGKADAAAQS